MIKFIIVAVLFGLAAADNIDKNAEILKFHNELSDKDGNFAYAFDTTNGISVKESGNFYGVSGSAQWVSHEGIPIEFTYTADENGYHPSGVHLPTPPPIPDYILRSLEYIRTHAPQEEVVRPKHF